MSSQFVTPNTEAAILARVIQSERTRPHPGGRPLLAFDEATPHR